MSSNPDLDLCTGGWVVVFVLAVTAGWAGEEEGVVAVVASSSSSSAPGQDRMKYLQKCEGCTHYPMAQWLKNTSLGDVIKVFRKGANGSLALQAKNRKIFTVILH